VHHLGHTVGSLLKEFGVPARDAQTILGPTGISATLEIYTDTDEQARRDALTRLPGLLDQGQACAVATGSSYRRLVCDLGTWSFGWCAGQNSNPRPAA